MYQYSSRFVKSNRKQTKKMVIALLIIQEITFFIVTQPPSQSLQFMLLPNNGHYQ